MSKFKEKVVSSRPDRELRKKVVRPGNFMLVPYEDARCRVFISEIQCRNEAGECPVDPGSRILKHNFDNVILIGDEDHFIDQDIELILQQMCNGEICEVKMIYKDGDGKLRQEISFILELFETTDEQVFGDWSWLRLFEVALHHKNRGVDLTKLKKIPEAFQKFNKSFKMLVSINQEGVPDGTRQEMFETKLILYNNMAFCQLEFKEYEAALTNCNMVLTHEPNNLKAMYRRALAYEGLGRYEEAWKDISYVQKMNPHDKAVQAKAAQLKPKSDEVRSSYINVIKSMFK